MIILFLSPRVGMVNKFIELLGGTTVNFMGERGMWRNIYVWTGVWQTMGWSSVVYFAALSGVNPEYHEAAIVDGATKLQRIIHIDLPTILPVAVMLLILSFGSLLSIGFEKVYALQNPLNLSVSEIISTYVYKLGILNNDMAYSSAIGLFNSAVNAVLLITVNTISRKLSDNALW
jgi:putative aldouronate transport system permease protein